MRSVAERLVIRDRGEEPPAAQDAAAALKIAVAGIGALIIAATLVWQVYHFLPMPIQDDIFDRLRFYRASAGGLGSLLAYFIVPHNEHRIATTRLFADLDEKLFYGREFTQRIVTNLLQIACAGLIYRFAFDAKPNAYRLPDKLLMLSAIVLVFINPNLFYTLLVPFQLQHAIMAFLATVGALLVCAASDRVMTREDQTRLIAALVVLAVIGTFTLGNSPSILIAAAITAAVLRWNRRLVITLSVLAVLHTAIVLLTTTPVGTTTDNVVEILKFGVMYWGSPFMRFDPWPASFVTYWSSQEWAVIFGVIVLLTAPAFGYLRYRKPGLGGRTAVFGLMIVIVVIATGLAAGHSRAQFGLLEATNKKYASFAALGWVGVLAVAAGIARDHWAAGRWRDTGVFAVFLAVMLPLSIVGYVRETAIWQKMIDRTWENSLAVFLHVDDKPGLREIYVDNAGLAEYVRDVEPRKRSIFSYFPFRWGDDARKTLANWSETACRSEVQTVTPLAPADISNIFHAPGTPVTITGWTWMTDEEAPPQTVIAVDAKDRIVGVARVTRTDERPEEWLGQGFDRQLGWFGYARLTQPPPLNFIALSSDGYHYCTLGGVGNVR